MGERKYVSDIIGDEYKEWERGNAIFIKTPTGSGKTTFILKNLLEYAESTNMKILYLVNRTILRDQIINKINLELRYDFPAINDILTIKTYQEIEAECRNNLESIYEKSSEYKYIVADECHYFLCDSTFNTNTKLSYDYIRSKRGNSIQIFMSATIDNMEKIISGKGNATQDKEINSKIKISFIKKFNRGVTEKTDDYENIPYDADSNFSNIKLHILKGIKDICDRISENKGKWLIFVDSIKNGIAINNVLLKHGLDSVFIDSEKKNNDSATKKVVKDIAKYEMFKQNIIVATSVMDNGVSISDINLRNLIIMSYTKEEFLQMLGRVRMDIDQNDADNRILNLYIFMRSKSFFRKKMPDIEQRIENIALYRKYTSEMEEILKMQGIRYSLKKEIENLLNVHAARKAKECIRHITDHYESEKSLNNMFEKVLRSNSFYEFVKHSCIVIDNAIVLNSFSDWQYKFLYDFYKNICDRFDKEGDYAFVKQQAEWLGIKDITSMVQESHNDEKGKILSIIAEYTREDFDKKQNLELRERIRIPVRDLLKQCVNQENSQDIESLVKELGKSSNGNPPRTLTPDKFNSIMDILNLQYEMEQDKDRNYFISEKQQI